MISIVAPNKDQVEWQSAIKAVAPDIQVSLWPEVDERSTLLVCWDPPEQTFRRLPNLKAIYVMGAGTDQVMNHPERPNDIPVYRLRTKQLAEDMYDYVFHCIESWRLNMPTYYKNKSSQRWQPLHYRSRQVIQVTVLGLGHIGAYVAENLSSCGYQVSGWSRSAKDISSVHCHQGANSILESVSQADCVINLLALNSDTEGVLNKQLFAMMAPSSCLINVARGAHLIEQDLIQAMNNPVQCAFLDVFQQEPMPDDHPFWSHPDISITPHIASLTNPESAIPEILDIYHSL